VISIYEMSLKQISNIILNIQLTYVNIIVVQSL